MSSQQISVTVKFFANLRKYGPKREEISISKESSIKDILDKFDVPEEDRNVVLIVNGKPHKKVEDIVHNGDIVAIFPPIAGG